MPGDRMYAPTIVRRTDLAPRVNYPSRVLSRDSYEIGEFVAGELDADERVAFYEWLDDDE